MAEYSLGGRLAVGRTSEVYAVDDQPQRVAKLFLPGFEANAARELGIAQALQSLGIEAPRVFGTVDVEGRTGIVMERVEGPPLLNLLSQKPWTTRAIGTLLADVHAPIHRAHAAELPPLHDLLERQIDETDALSAGERSAAAELLGTLPGGDRLCHGDFHPGNVLLGDGGPVTIDWNNATAGDPLADVAKTSVLLRSGNPPHVPLVMKLVLRVVRAVLVSSYLRRYNELAPFDRATLRKWQTVVAAARLTEGIENERETLLGIARKGLAARR